MSLFSNRFFQISTLLIMTRRLGRTHMFSDRDAFWTKTTTLPTEKGRFRSQWVGLTPTFSNDQSNELWIKPIIGLICKLLSSRLNVTIKASLVYMYVVFIQQQNPAVQSLVWPNVYFRSFFAYIHVYMYTLPLHTVRERN